eukprot:Awhi_evm1s5998
MVQHSISGSDVDDFLINSATKDELKNLPARTKNRLLYLSNIPTEFSSSHVMDLRQMTVNCSSESSSSYACTYLIDGDIGTTAHTHSSNILTTKYFEIDLASTRPINGFEIYNRQDCGHERIVGIQIEILDENRNLVKAYDYDEWDEILLVYGKFDIRNVFGRYFLIKLETNVHLQIGEVILYENT